MSAGLFDLFTAEASISTSFLHTETVTNGMTFTYGDCANRAIVYWRTLYDYWIERNGDSNDRYEI